MTVVELGLYCRCRSGLLLAVERMDWGVLMMFELRKFWICT